MLIYPNINPIILHLGPIKIYWYGVMYLLSFIIIGWLIRYRANKLQLNWSNEKVIDLLFYGALGVIIGGRLGYMIFYDLPHFIQKPWAIIKVWQGGMSFHGGLLGVLIMLLLWSRKTKQSFFFTTDLIAPMVPIGIAAGRIGNFINGELWGKITNIPWGMIYPHVDSLPRHPSEIYEFLTEGIPTFLILWVYSMKPKPRMAVSGLFLFCYGSARCFCEFFRQPDPQYGYLAFGWLTMGQLLSLPMLALGVVLLYFAYANKRGSA